MYVAVREGFLKEMMAQVGLKEECLCQVKRGRVSLGVIRGREIIFLRKNALCKGQNMKENAPLPENGKVLNAEEDLVNMSRKDEVVEVIQGQIIPVLVCHSKDCGL